MTPAAVSAGRPWPLGATLVPGGVNFAVQSAHATGLELCLYAVGGRHETARLPFAERTGDIWHMLVEGVGAGQLYGLRAHGPYEPEAGHRFNAHKLLLDPYAKGWSGRLRWSDALMGYKPGSPRGDLSFDTRDSAFAMPKSVVVEDAFDWGDDRPPQTPWSQTVIYEAHVAGADHGASGAADRAARHLWRAWPSGDDRPSAPPWHHCGRAVAGSRLV